MTIMKKEEVEATIIEINKYLQRCLWMDFTLSRSDGGQIDMFGAIDQTYNNYIDNYEIKVVFEQPHFFSGIFSWSLDKTKPFIEMCSDDETTELNIKYAVEQGNYIFKINAGGFETSSIFLASKKIHCQILNYEPFPSPALTYPIYLARTYPKLEIEPEVPVIYSIGYSADNLIARFGIILKTGHSHRTNIEENIGDEAYNIAVNAMKKFAEANPGLGYPQKLTIGEDGVLDYTMEID